MLVVGPEARVEGWGDAPGWVRCLVGDHPLPTERSVAAGEAVLGFCESVQPAERVLVLLSGGASAQVCVPVEGVTLEDVRACVDGMLRGGATINELNAVRKWVDRTKGGRLAVACAGGGARVDVLLLADVVRDAVGTVSSGPFAACGVTRAEAMAGMDRVGVGGVVREALERVDPPPGDEDAAFSRVRHEVIGSHETLAEAAAGELRRQGFDGEVETRVEGEAADVGRRLVAGLQQGHARVLAGEAVVSGVPKGAKGGPAQEVAVSGAVGLEGVDGEWVMLGLASDGVDGPTDAAGGVVASWCDLAGAREALRGHEVYGWLEGLGRGAGARLGDPCHHGGLIRTGPTGTNLNDVYVGVRW